MLSVINSVEQLGCLAAQQKLSTIARVLEVADYITPDGAYQIIIDAQALGAIGRAYDLTLDFSPDTLRRRNQLLRDLKPGAIYRVKGRYWVFAGEPICLLEPTYSRIALSANVAASVFNRLDE